VFRTVRVMLHAGLGNQMFMYAAGRALALRIGARLVLDTSWFRRDTVYKRVYLLDRLPIVGRAVDGTVLTRNLPFRVVNKCERVVRGQPLLSGLCGVISEQREGDWVRFEPRLVEQCPRRSLVIDGYWQSERYFASHADVIGRELMPPRPTHPEAVADLAMVEAAAYPVAVCIRFYLEAPGSTADHRGIIAAYRAVLADHHRRHPDATYFLVTEEPGLFAEADCLGVPFRILHHYHRNEDATINMYVMSRCRGFLLGFSSYHWWGAWLSRAPGDDITYVRFPGDRKPNYVPETWRIVDL